MSEAGFELILRRDRAIVGASLAAIVALSWAYLLWLGAGGMPGGATPETAMPGMAMPGMDMPEMADAAILGSSFMPWSLTDAVFMFSMWTVMMVGMMIPSAAPMILLYARVGRQALAKGQPFAAAAWFAAGYLAAWTAFALAATAAQWALERAALLTPMMTSASDALGGAILAAAGLYQWSALKTTCLSQCQAPLAFIQRHGGFRREPWPALLMGTRHGMYCIGCCWALMALLFVGGVMNLLWIGGLAILVFAEKVIPAGRVISRLAGVILIFSGLWLLADALRPGAQG